MNTPSHLIINAAILKKTGRKDIPSSAFLWGSVAPGIPLGLLSLGYFFYNHYIAVQPVPGGMSNAFDNLFFNNPWWIAFHNFLHSPVALFAYLVFLWHYRTQPGTRGNWWLWFVLGCMVHTAIDIPVHATDGPLLFWPLDWHIRFHSPVSYYDPAHYGIQFAIFEITLDILLLGYLFLPKLVARFKK